MCPRRSRKPSLHFGQTQAQAVHISERLTLIPNSRSLAHELNNKLGIILTHCELVRLQIPAESKSSQHLRAIRNAAQAIADIIRDSSRQLP
jgi:signal transduction histidine kinase